MKIVIVIDLIDNLTNGSVMTAKRFADGLRARGHSVKIVAIGADGKDDVCVKERYVPLLTEVSAKNQVKYGKFDREKIKAAFEGADLVHFIFPFKEMQIARGRDGYTHDRGFPRATRRYNFQYPYGKAGLFEQLYLRHVQKAVL